MIRATHSKMNKAYVAFIILYFITIEDVIGALETGANEGALETESQDRIKTALNVLTESVHTNLLAYGVSCTLTGQSFLKIADLAHVVGAEKLNNADRLRKSSKALYESGTAQEQANTGTAQGQANTADAERIRTAEKHASDADRLRIAGYLYKVLGMMASGAGQVANSLGKVAFHAGDVLKNDSNDKTGPKDAVGISLMRLADELKTDDQTGPKDGAGDIIKNASDDQTGPKDGAGDIITNASDGQIVSIDVDTFPNSGGSGNKAHKP